MYQISLPVFLRYLDRLNERVNVAEAHGQAQRLEASSLLDARLAPDMSPFEVQVQVAAKFALRACFPLAGEGVPASLLPARAVRGVAEECFETHGIACIEGPPLGEWGHQR